MSLKVITLQKWKDKMEIYKVRVVNKGLSGEPHHYCFQHQESGKIIYFTEISQVVKNGEIIEVGIEDSDISNEYIQIILNDYGHVIDLRHMGDDGYEIIF
jgi:hypothetical protein